MAALDAFRIDDSYQTFRFRRDDSDVRDQVLWTYVISGTGSTCYEICTYKDETFIKCRGSAEDHIPAAKFRWGAVPSVARGLGRPAPLDTLLSGGFETGSHAKTLRCGNREYEWHIDAIIPAECSYKIVDRKDSSTALARLRVVQGHSGSSFSVEISTHIWLHSQMCNSIIAAVVLMCKQDDPWLAGSGSGLV